MVNEWILRQRTKNQPAIGDKQGQQNKGEMILCFKHCDSQFRCSPN